MNKCFPDDNNYPLHTDDVTYYGLTKREYFAGLALQGLCSHYGTDHGAKYEMARFSANIADLLILELNK